MNHKGTRMTRGLQHGRPGNFSRLVSHVQQARKTRHGCYQHEAVGEGTFKREDRKRPWRFAFRTQASNSVTVATEYCRNRRSHREFDLALASPVLSIYVADCCSKRSLCLPLAAGVRSTFLVERSIELLPRPIGLRRHLHARNVKPMLHVALGWRREAGNRPVRQVG